MLLQWVAFTLTYWLAALLLYVAVRRLSRFRPAALLRRLSARSETVTPVSDREYVVTFSDSINLRHLAAIAFMPPAILLVVLLIVR